MQDSSELFSKLEAQSFQRRFMLGIVGYPGAGKSTLAETTVAEFNSRSGQEVAIVVPMDGFHLSNEELTKMGLLELKGVPESFDAKGFVELLTKLKRLPDQTIGCPLFDRSIEASIANGIQVKPEHKLLVVEGNYLLLDRPPWNDIRALLDECWFIDSSLDVISPRLLERHLAGGRTTAGALQKMECTDLPNARLIEETRARADRVIQ